MSVDLEKVIQMHNDGVQFTTQIMDDAAIHGRLDVVKWLHENRTEGCTKVAMSMATINGHLDVIKWLHENRRLYDWCNGFGSGKWISKYCKVAT